MASMTGSWTLALKSFCTCASGPGNYSSWESCQAATVNLAGGPGKRYKSVKLSLPAWHARCRLGEHDHALDPNYDPTPPAYSQLAAPTLDSEEIPMLVQISDDEDETTTDPSLICKPQAEDIETAQLRGTLTLNGENPLVALDGLESLKRVARPVHISPPAAPSERDLEQAERVAAGFGMTARQLAIRGIEWMYFRSDPRVATEEITPEILSQYEELRRQEALEAASALRAAQQIVDSPYSTQAGSDDEEWAAFESDEVWERSFFTDTSTSDQDVIAPPLANE
ncbi:hypothetical protein B0H11DRAFT_2247495 [Mycena galericulata]|nr:hypothetical protein B0H11DRAFT_2247495 [Mycena galericulata]